MPLLSTLPTALSGNDIVIVYKSCELHFFVLPRKALLYAYRSKVHCPFSRSVQSISWQSIAKTSIYATETNPFQCIRRRLTSVDDDVRTGHEPGASSVLAEEDGDELADLLGGCESVVRSEQVDRDISIGRVDRVEWAVTGSNIVRRLRSDAGSLRMRSAEKWKTKRIRRRTVQSESSPPKP